MSYLENRKVLGILGTLEVPEDQSNLLLLVVQGIQMVQKDQYYPGDQKHQVNQVDLGSHLVQEHPYFLFLLGVQVLQVNLKSTITYFFY